MMQVAIFDFDRTLFPEETFPLLMKHLKTHPTHAKKYQSFLAKILPVYAAYKCKLYPEQRMKAYSMQCYISSFGKASEAELAQFFSQLGDTMSQRLSEAVLQRLEDHKKKGHYIMLVSGAFEQLLHAVAKDLSIDCIIGTRTLLAQRKGRRIPIDYVNGERKREVIEEQLQNQEIDWENSFAYGDSYSDLDVLQLVGNPVAVQPDARLRQLAHERDWEILAP